MDHSRRVSRASRSGALESRRREELSSIREDLRGRIDYVESAYEFMLAFAAQGLPSDAGSSSGAQIRDELRRLAGSLEGLGDAFSRLVEEDEGLEARDEQRAFVKILAQDAESALACVRLVLAQGAISSQLVDNLNATIHLRALLTDIFLVDEILKILGSETPAAEIALDSDS